MRRPYESALRFLGHALDSDTVATLILLIAMLVVLAVAAIGVGEVFS